MQSISCASTRAPIPVTCNDKSSFSGTRLSENGTPFEPIQTPENACSGGAADATAGQSRAEAAPPGGGAAGLVPSKTSGTSKLTERQRGALSRSFGLRIDRENQAKAVPSGAIRIDREATRLKRLKCSVLTAARLHVQQKARWKVAMLTLTYAPQWDWSAGQISDLVRHIRQWLRRKGVEMRHVWVQEFTKKGRPHYHLLLWLPAGLSLPKPDKRGWWPYGMTKIEWARNAVGYIAKYASKGDSLQQPEKGARMHGNGGVTGDALLEQRWWKLPSWLRDDVVPSDRVRRAASGQGGGFVSPETGQAYRSPWEVLFIGGQVFIKRKEVL